MIWKINFSQKLNTGSKLIDDRAQVRRGKTREALLERKVKDGWLFYLQV